MKKKQNNNKQRPAKDLPPAAFCDWWNPTGREEPSGADIGGHPDAERQWARKDPGCWTRRTYGINANLAWLSEEYRQEYYRWREAGRPKMKPFVSLALPPAEQQAAWKVIGGILRGAAKPMPVVELPDEDIDFTRRSYNNE